MGHLGLGPGPPPLRSKVGAAGYSPPGEVHLDAELYEAEKRNQAPVSVIMKHWGYKNPTSGRASTTFAALKKFGLVRDEGSGLNRPAALTQLAVEILLNPEPEDAIRRAALTPPIHRELWDEYGVALPSVDNLTWKLIERGFTPVGAKEFVRQYQETIAYAGLDKAGSGGDTQDADLDAGEEDDDGKRDEAAQRREMPPRRRVVNGDTLTIPVPIVGGPPVTVEGEFPISEAAWTQFMAVLAAMKPGLVAEPPAPDGEA